MALPPCRFVCASLLTEPARNMIPGGQSHMISRVIGKSSRQF